MSKGAVDQVIKRAIGDAAFRAKLQSDPASALAGFDLTKDERSAITSGDPKRLTALGVDQRMSKAFDIGAQGGATSKVISPDASGLTAKALIDETSATGNRLDEGFVTRTTTAREPVDVSGDFNRLDEGVVSLTTTAREDGSSMNATNLRRIEGDLNTATAREPVDVSGDFNRLDEGIVGGSESKFETAVDPRSDGFLAKELDPGMVADTRATDATNTDSHTPGSTTDAGGNTITE